MVLSTSVGPSADTGFHLVTETFVLEVSETLASLPELGCLVSHEVLALDMAVLGGVPEGSLSLNILFSGLMCGNHDWSPQLIDRLPCLLIVQWCEEAKIARWVSQGPSPWDRHGTISLGSEVSH